MLVPPLPERCREGPALGLSALRQHLTHLSILPSSMQAGLFVGAGVDKIRLTGGEPTLRPDLPELVGRLAALPGLRAVGLTTNGLALERRLPALREAGAAGWLPRGGRAGGSRGGRQKSRAGGS